MTTTPKTATERPRIVRHDPQIGLSTLFRPLASGARPKLDVTYQPAKGGGVVLQFSGKDALGIPEQTLLLVLLELAQERRYESDGTILDANAETCIARALWGALYRHSEGTLPATLHFSTTWYELASRVGHKPGGSRQELLQAQLKRLCECVVWEKYSNTVFQSSLVAMVRGDDKRVHIALNVRLADAIWDDRYMPVSLSERLQLKTSISRALHAHFSVWLRAGEGQRVGIDTLVERLWPRANGRDGKARSAIPEGTVRSRRSNVRSALREIDRLEHWSIEEVDASVVMVSREPDKKSGSQSAEKPDRRKMGARKKTCQTANARIASCGPSPESKASSDLGFGTIDASALFVSR